MKDDLGLFDIIKSISENKKSILEHEEFNKQYNPFMINRFLGSSIDTLFFANILDQYSHLPKDLQYMFYLKGVDKKKRYLQYVKTPKISSNIENIIKYYQCNHNQALEYVELLNEEQIDIINKTFASRIERN